MGPPAQWWGASDLGPVVVAGFRDRHGQDPTAVARAPGRVNLVGDHTDYLGGLCLPLALPHSTWVAWAPRGDGRRVLTSGGHEPWDAPSDVVPHGWARYVAAALDAVGRGDGASVHVESRVPVGAGLASSAALICATAVAATGAPGERLVDPCIAAERDGVGVPTGGLDQTVALLAEPGHALLLDFATGSRSPVPWSPARAGVELLVVDTGTRHAHSTGGYGDRRREGEAAVAAGPDVGDPLLLRRRRHVLSENQRVRAVVDALVDDDWGRVGELFNASHASLRDDYEVSCVELDTAVGAARSSGALGARMTGGGFGGCALVLTPSGRREAVVAGVREAFAARGWDAPAFLPTEGGSAALRADW